MVPVSLRKDTRLGAAEVVSDRARHPSPSFSGGGRVRPGEEVVRDSAAVRAPPQIGTSPPRSDNDTAGDAVATDLGRTARRTVWDAVKFGEASRSLGRHKAAHRRTITHRLRRRRLQRDGPQRKPFSGGFVVAAAEKEEEEGEVFIASSLFFSSFPPIRTCETRRGTAANRKKGKKKQEKENRHACFLSSALFSRAAEISLVHFTHQLFHLTEFQVRPSWSPTFALLLPTDGPTAGRTRYIVPAEAKTQRAPALRSTEGGGELKTGSREGERGAKK